MKRKTFEQVVLPVLDEKRVWTLSDQVLYDLCKKHPKHVHDEEIIAKIFLIGRSYAAQIERGENTKKNPSFYEEVVVPGILKAGNAIDDLIDTAQKEKNAQSIFELYDFLVKQFKKIGDKKHISLASKYLHFHLPDLFYIYDSRAASSIGTLLKILSGKNRLSKKDALNLQKPVSEDSEIYTNFYNKCRVCVEKIKEQYKRKISPRELDILLLKIDAINAPRQKA